EAAAGRGSDHGRNSTPREADPGRRRARDRRAALYRRAPLRGGGDSDRALRRRAALDSRSERARRQRELAPRGPARRDQDRRHGGRGLARDAVSCKVVAGSAAKSSAPMARTTMRHSRRTPARESNAASNALAIASLLLPARTASPMAITICPGLANCRKWSAVARRPL